MAKKKQIIKTEREGFRTTPEIKKLLADPSIELLGYTKSSFIEESIRLNYERIGLKC